MPALLQGLVPKAVWPLAFVIVFLLIGGAALYLTPRISGWLDERRGGQRGYYDGMLEHPPDELPAEDEDKEE